MALILLRLNHLTEYLNDSFRIFSRFGGVRAVDDLALDADEVSYLHRTTEGNFVHLEHIEFHDIVLSLGDYLDKSRVRSSERVAGGEGEVICSVHYADKSADQRL